MKNIWLILGLLLIVGCQEEKKSESKSEKEAPVADTLVADSTQMLDTVVVPELSDELVKLLKKKTKEFDLPFELDSVGFSKVLKVMDSKLNSKEIKLLTKSLLDHEYTEEIEWRTKHLLEMEERKRKGEYEEYASSLDIGMLKEIDGFMGPVLQIDEHSFLILWSIQYGSFEACPYYSGTIIAASLVYNNELKNTALIGEVSGGGDAPVWGDTEIYSSISPEGIICRTTDRICEGDEDANGNEIVETTKSEVNIRITEEGFMVESGK